MKVLKKRKIVLIANAEGTWSAVGCESMGIKSTKEELEHLMRDTAEELQEEYMEENGTEVMVPYKCYEVLVDIPLPPMPETTKLEGTVKDKE